MGQLLPLVVGLPVVGGETGQHFLYRARKVHMKGQKLASQNPCLLVMLASQTGQRLGSVFFSSRSIPLYFP
jgi:hypothetical protein